MKDLLGLNNSFRIAHDPFPFALLAQVDTGSEIWEKDGTTYIELAVPGVKPEDVEIQAQDRTINVNWKRRIRGTEEKSYKSYQVSKDVDLDSIQAKVEDGLLTIELRKSPKAMPRKIQVLGPNTVKQMG